MKLIQGITAGGVIILTAFFAMALPSTTTASALLYKSYVVRQDQGRDILCDNYIVQQNDFILKLFRESGEISQTDFPEFLNVFSRINPNIPNINRIQSGQRILIPLKKLSPESLPGQQTGVVTIPFVTISTLPELLKSNSSKYIIQKGDTISQILSRSFGNIGTKAYHEASQIFQVVNPDVSSLNKVKMGQSVWLPQASVINQPWYSSLFDDAGNLVTRENIPFSNQMPSPPPPPPPRSSLEKAATLLEARVFNKGAYYFPRPGVEDFELDLSLFPVLELSDRSRTLIVPPSSSHRPGISESDVATVKSSWKPLSILSVDPNAPAEEILEAFFNSDQNKMADNKVSFGDNGVQVTVRARWWLNQTGEKKLIRFANNKKVGLIPPVDPEAGNTAIILEYLVKHGVVLRETRDEEKEPPIRAKSSVLLPPIIPSAPPAALVTALMTALALPFSPGVAISFPYGGIQIPAVSNLVSTGEGRSILVDFGNLYGEAIEAIKNSGLDVVRITPQDSHYDTIRKLLTATGHSYETDPTFAAAKAPGALGVELSIPGFLVSRGGGTKTLLSRVLLDPDLIRFLNEREIKIVQIDEENTER
jgi:hypothetical protein